MGRSIKRVPLDFDFPLDESFADAMREKHVSECEDHDEDRCAAEFSWEPPTGEGWQLWQTVSGGPITPVFATAEELIDYMSQPVPVEKQERFGPFAGPYPPLPGAQGWRREIAEHFVRETKDAPSAVIDEAQGTYESGAEAAYYISLKKPR